MSALAVLKRPDIFKAAVAGAPVTDWEDYDTYYTERYLGLLPESSKAYHDASLMPLASQLSRPLLLIHGTADDNVYFRHTLHLAEALFRAGKAFELLPLPGLLIWSLTRPCKSVCGPESLAIFGGISMSLGGVQTRLLYLGCVAKIVMSWGNNLQRRTEQG